MLGDRSENYRVPHATCLGCGCLCDDITVEVEGGRVVGAERACPIGVDWFLAAHPGDGHPPASIAGRPVPVDEALDRATLILKAAKSPVVWGLTWSSTEAVGAALAIADRIGASVDLAGSELRGGHRAAFVRLGQVSSTLGEVKDRAEVVLFWGNHPDLTHPRHAERYSIHPRGRFLPDARTVMVVDVGPDVSGGVADVRVSLPFDRQAEALAVLGALARGVSLDSGRVERATGQPIEVWEHLIGRLEAARSSAIFFGPATGRLGATGWDAALGLVRDLNAGGRRCVGLGLGEPGNVGGAEAVVCWQAGAPGRVDFGSGSPRYLPLEAGLADRLASGEADAALLVGDDPARSLSPENLARLGAIPSIWVAPGATDPARSSWRPTVAIDSARLGIESGGTVARVDGVMLPLRPPLGGSRPTDLEVLGAIAGRLLD